MKKIKYSQWVMALLLGFVGCGGDFSGDDGGGASDPSQEPGGGNVGFGGAQDIGQFRSILDSGGVPGEATLDANGFFSEHYTELPPPECGQVLCAHGMLAVGSSWLTGDYQAALQIAMNTQVDPTELERLPLNLVVVVDTSGSMLADDRLGYVKQGLNLLIEQLEDGDRLALISYSRDVWVHSDLSVPLDRAALYQRVQELTANGSTNIYDGLRTGLQMAADNFDLERQNRVILLSDGMATAGITNDFSILSMAVDFISDGIGLTTIGVGQDFNVELMRGLAERGAGNFYFVESAEATEEVFVDELDYFVTPLAVAVELTVDAGAGYSLGEAVGTRLWQAEGNRATVFIPGVFVASRLSDEPDPNGGRRGGGSKIIVPMIPTGVTPPDPREVASISLRYRLPGTSEVLEQSITVNNPADPGVPPSDYLYISHQAMAENYAMYNIYLGLREATRAADTDYNCAMSVLDTLVGELARWNAEFGDEDIAADQALIAQFMGNLSAAGALSPEELGFDACLGYDDYYE
ncbi:MAG: VWA domain-containing protein, partial [Myxococcota bacterium]